MADATRHCAYFRTFGDAVAIRRRLGPGSRVAIVGGGFIGLELAASAREDSAVVIVIEAQPRILTRGVPAEIAAVLHAWHGEAGVEILCVESVTGIAEDAGTVRLVGRQDRRGRHRRDRHRRRPCDRPGRGGGTGHRQRDRRRCLPPHERPAHLCRQRLLLLSAGALRGAVRPPRSVAQRAGARRPCGPQHARRRRGLCRRALVLVRSARPRPQIAGLPDESRSTVRRDLGNDAFVLFHLSADGRLVAASGIGPGNAVARDVRLAEMLIAGRTAPAAGELARPEIKLKSLLAP